LINKTQTVTLNHSHKLLKHKTYLHVDYFINNVSGIYTAGQFHSKDSSCFHVDVIPRHSGTKLLIHWRSGIKENVHLIIVIPFAVSFFIFSTTKKYSNKFHCFKFVSLNISSHRPGFEFHQGLWIHRCLFVCFILTVFQLYRRVVS
jgi:hypothetical protein